MKQSIRALIAEDEPLLATNLQAELHACWPELQVVANVRDGQSAVAQCMQHQPDIVFLDIHMPKLNGLEVAEIIMEEWDETKQSLPYIVFVTAYDAYAIQAFERAAFDYLLKPIQRERLQASLQRLQKRIQERTQKDSNTSEQSRLDGMQQLPKIINEWASDDDAINHSSHNNALLSKVLQVTSGNTIHMVKLDDIVYFEAADKYLRVFTKDKDYVVRSTLREMQALTQLGQFWQIHRSLVVRVEAIDKAVRQTNGKLLISLRDRPETLQVSRLYAHLFKAS